MAPTKLTPETQRLLVQAIDRGLRTKVDICSHAEINPATLNVWERQAAAGDPAAQALFAALARARARVKRRYLRKMQVAGKDDWRMWREMLALVDPEEYGKAPAQSLTLDGKVQAQVAFEDVTLDDEQRAERIAALFDAARARRAGRAAGESGEAAGLAGDGAA